MAHSWLRHVSLALAALALTTAACVTLVALSASPTTPRAPRGASQARREASAGPAKLPAAVSPSPAASADPQSTADASGGAGKTQPPEPTPSPGGTYPYPMDAGPQVSTGGLTLSRSSASAGSEITVSASADGWVSGHEILVFLGQRYEVTLAGPGARARLVVPQADLGTADLPVSGFQFPDNNPAAPIDGFGTATLKELG